MTVSLQCPHCGARYQVAEAMLGKQARCRCGATIPVPPAPVANPASAAAKPAAGKIGVQCSACGKRHQAGRELLGKTVRCQCGAAFVVTAPDASGLVPQPKTHADPLSPAAAPSSGINSLLDELPATNPFPEDAWPQMPSAASPAGGKEQQALAQYLTPDGIQDLQKSRQPKGPWSFLQDSSILGMPLGTAFLRGGLLLAILLVAAFSFYFVVPGAGGRPYYTYEYFGRVGNNTNIIGELTEGVIVTIRATGVGDIEEKFVTKRVRGGTRGSHVETVDEHTIKGSRSKDGRDVEYVIHWNRNQGVTSVTCNEREVLMSLLELGTAKFRQDP